MRKLWMAATLLSVVALAAARAGAAGGEPDVSTPAGAQRAAVTAMKNENEKEVRKFLHGATPIENEVADVMAANAVAGSRVYNAAVKKFGEETARKELVGLVPMQPTDTEMDKMQWKVDGDKATPVDSDQKKYVQGSALRKVDNVWKMSVSDLRQGHSDEELKQMETLIEKQTKMLNETAKEINDGKYATVGDLKKATIAKMRTLMQEIMQNAATQRTATQPATTNPSKAPAEASGVK